jgi:hypothetical protein
VKFPQNSGYQINDSGHKNISDGSSER